jgi:hypothetical protein
MKPSPNQTMQPTARRRTASLSMTNYQFDPASLPRAVADLILLRRMKTAKTIIGVSRLILLLIGFLGIAASLFEMFDPSGSKMADDGDPFGTPPSLLSSLFILFISLCLCGVGAFLIWRSVRKSHVSA